MLPEPYDDLFFAIGLIFIVYHILNIVLYIWRILRRICASDILSKYGRGSWVVITGASDGIGRGFAEQLAERGFNLVLIARNKAKLEKVASEINALNPHIKINIVVADFSNAYKDGFFDEIYNQIKDLDVSILINNVGTDIIIPFENAEEEYLRNMLTINVFPIVLLTRKMINQFIARPKKSAVINLSSASHVIEMPYVTTYSSTKTLGHHFTMSLQIEYPNIDFLSVRPGYVQSALTDRKEPTWDTITSNECAEGALRELGKYPNTFTHIKHEFVNFLLTSQPKWLRDPLIKHIFMQGEMDRRKKAKANANIELTDQKKNGIYIPLVDEN